VPQVFAGLKDKKD